MILWTQPDGSVLATPQPAHAIIAGQLMRALADQRQLSLAQVGRASSGALELLRDWCEAGWLHPQQKDRDD